MTIVIQVYCLTTIKDFELKSINLMLTKKTQLIKNIYINIRQQSPIIVIRVSCVGVEHLFRGVIIHPTNVAVVMCVPVMGDCGGLRVSPW